MTRDATKTPLVVFGAGKTAETLAYYCAKYSDYEIVGYVCDEAYASGTVAGRKITCFHDAPTRFPPDQCQMFVAAGYRGLNGFRETKCAEARAMGYTLARLIFSDEVEASTVGDNCFVAPGVHVQPFVEIGSNVFLWSGTSIGHYSRVGDNVWLPVNVAINGEVEIGPNSFVGSGSVIGHRVKIGHHCFIGAGALITKDVNDHAVIVRPQTDTYPLSSDRFCRMLERGSERSTDA